MEDDGNSDGSGSIRKNKNAICKGVPKNKELYREYTRIFPLATLVVPNGRFP